MWLKADSKLQFKPNWENLQNNPILPYKTALVYKPMKALANKMALQHYLSSAFC